MTALVTAFREARERHPDRAFVVEEATTWTFASVGQWADEIAAKLAGFAGPVAIRLPSGAAFVAAFLGALMAGCTVVPIDPRLVPREVAFLTEHAGCVATIAEDGISEARRGDVVGEAVVVLYTSGSTARPKGVVLDQQAIVANARAWCARYAIGPGDALLSVLSLFHSFGMTAGLVSAILTGARLVVVDHPLPARIAELATRHRATIVLAVSTVHAWLVRSPGSAPSAFPDVRLFLSGACKLPVDVARDFERKFGRPIHQTYGLTEAAPVVTAMPIGEVRHGTVGSALGGVEVRVMGDELEVRGPGIMRGYLDDLDATRAVIDADGWLRTGDCARIDNDGFVTILGRSKDLITRAGSKIYPEEIEEVLREYTGVDDAAVVGLPHAQHEEVPVAFVVARESAEIDRDGILAFCRERLALYKVPRSLHVIGALPRNPNGKVLKRELRSLARTTMEGGS
jgi:long-chain acyl-CoA synthetase